MSDIEDDNLYMRFSTYEREIKDTPIVSIPPKGPTVDKMQILMDDIIKWNDKWVESTRATRKRMGATGSFVGMSSGAQTILMTTFTIVATTIASTCPSHSICKGGDQHPEKNIQDPSTCGEGSLANIGKVGDGEVGKDKEREK